MRLSLVLRMKAQHHARFDADMHLSCHCRPTTRPAAANVAAPQLEAPPSQATSGDRQFRTFNEKDFVLEVPRPFKEVRSEDSSGGFGSGGRPKSTYGNSCLVILPDWQCNS